MCKGAPVHRLKLGETGTVKKEQKVTHQISIIHASIYTVFVQHLM